MAGHSIILKTKRRKTHPSLIPYSELSESEKGKDRELVKINSGFITGY